MDFGYSAPPIEDEEDRSPVSAVMTRPARAAIAPAVAVPYVGSVYGTPRNRPLIALIVAAHALVLFALVKFDVVEMGKPPQPLEIKLIEVAPPPPPRLQPAAPQPPTQRVAVVAPPAIVPPLPAPPPPIAVAPAPPPPAPEVQAPAPPAAAVPAVAAPGPVSAPDLMADVIQGTPPRYPTESRRLRETGTVRLRLLISTLGAVAEIAVAQSSGHDRLDRAALEAVRKWRFRARTRAGQAAEAIGFLPITFALPH